MEYLRALFKTSFLALLVLEIILLSLYGFSLFSRPRFERALYWVDSTLAQGDPELEILPGGSLKVSNNGSGPAVIRFNDISLPQGKYNVYVDYDGSDINYESDYVKISDNTNGIYKFWSISDWNSLISNDIYLGKASDNITIDIKYSGEKTFVLKSIYILEEGRLFRFLVYIFAALIINLFYTLYICEIPGLSDKRSWRNLRITIAVLFAAIVFTSLPAFLDYLPFGDDINYHACRINAIAVELRRGQLPVRIYHDYNTGHGYPASIFYGEALLYPSALLVMAGAPVFRAYQFMLILINTLTAAIAYISFKRIFVSQTAGLLGAFLYTLSPYRIINLYHRAAIGEASAQAFIPLLICGAYLLVCHDGCFSDNNTAKPPRRNNTYIWIVLGATGLIQTHIITTQMCAIVWVLFMLAFIKRLLNKTAILQLISAGALTLAFNLWFLVPFLQYMPLLEGRGASMEQLQPIGLYPPQVFSVFMTSGGDIIRDGIKGEMPLSIGLSFMICGIMYAAVMLCTDSPDRQLKKAAAAFGAFGLLSLFMSTAYFPWDSLVALSQPLAHFTHAIQFTFRYLTPATALLAAFGTAAILLALGVKDSSEWKVIIISIIVFAGVLPISLYYTNYLNEAEIYYAHRLNSGSNRLYLPAGTSKNLFSLEDYYAETSELSYTVLENSKDTGKTLIWCNNPDNTDLSLTIPVTWYPDYHAYDNTGSPLYINKGYNNNVSVVIPSGYEGNITVAFIPPALWHFCEAVSLISLFAFLLLFLKKRLERGIVIANKRGTDALS